MTGELTIFEGHQALSQADLDEAARPYVGRMLDAADLEELRIKITKLYVLRGFINSGAQLGTHALGAVVEVDGGYELKVRLVEGRVSSVRTTGLQRLRQDYVIDRLLPDREAALNAEELRERFQLLLEDPLFERISGRLSPGEDAGQAVLTLDAVRAPAITIGVFFNNYRPVAIGSEAQGLRSTISNLTGWGDALEINRQSALGHTLAPRSNWAWRLPVGAGRTQIHVMVDSGASTVVEEPARSLGIRSRVRARELGVLQVLDQSLRTRTAAGLAFSRREASTTLGGEPFSFTPNEPSGLTALHSVRFWQERSLRSAQQVLALRSTFTRSSNNLQVEQSLPFNPPMPGTSAWFWLGQAQFERQFNRDADPPGGRIRIRSALQYSPQPLLALDRMSLGGVATVRGFRENQLVRDQGAQVSLEVLMPLFRSEGQKGPGMSVDWVPFIDWARGINHGEAGTTLASAGLALQLKGQGLKVDIARGHRLNGPPQQASPSGGLQDRGIHLQLMYETRFR